mmetsp:Transcript_35863/g.52627  ORF Transcript_35863/g.52627 Transcript_35863/m.52627 type:complete len:80 (-) Transcript_35863:94-333(-)
MPLMFIAPVVVVIAAAVVVVAVPVTWVGVAMKDAETGATGVPGLQSLHADCCSPAKTSSAGQQKHPASLTSNRGRGIEC